MADGVKKPLRAANLVMLRDRSLYPLIMRLCLGLIPVVLLVFGWGFFERVNKPLAQFYAVNNDQLYSMTALNQPNLTTEAMLSWAVEAATACYTFDFFNYPQVIQDVKVYFTDAGYQNFLHAIQAASIIQTIVKKKLVVSAVPTDTPIVLREGATPDGTYAWQIQVPMLITYQSASEQIKQNLILTLLISQVPTTESVKGVGIASFIVREANRHG